MRRCDPLSGGSPPRRISHANACRRRPTAGPIAGAYTAPRDRSPPLDQSDIDRKLAVAREKFPRSIKRIDQQETLGDLRLDSGRRRLLRA